jgi:hypothetical protein
MDMVKQVEKISQMLISKKEKIKLLEEVALDCYNDMEAQDQNMHPEVKHNNAEGYRIAKNLIRELET